MLKSGAEKRREQVAKEKRQKWVDNAKRIAKYRRVRAHFEKNEGKAGSGHYAKVFGDGGEAPNRFGKKRPRPEEAAAAASSEERADEEEEEEGGHDDAEDAIDYYSGSRPSGGNGAAARPAKARKGAPGKGFANKKRPAAAAEKRPDRYAKAKGEARATRDEAEERVRLQAKAEKEKKRKLNKRRMTHQKLSQRTSRGQPIMKHSIAQILGKLQAEEKRR
eukprot:g5352.t1